MGILLALLLLLLLFGGFGIAIHFLWIVAAIVIILMVVGYFGSWYGPRGPRNGPLL